MRGLLIKDYRLLWNQRRTLGIMMLIWAIVVFTNTNPAFAVSYLIFSCSILAINTVSYDQHENGIIFCCHFQSAGNSMRGRSICFY